MEIEFQKYLTNHPAACEYKFLFACCRIAFASPDKQIAYPEDVAPKVFLQLLQRHKLVTHLYPVLKNRCNGIPDGLLAALQDLLRQHNLQILKLSGELVRLSGLFAGQGIPWLSLKGPVLALQLYGDIAARQSGDLDILVTRANLEKAISVLLQAGYVPEIDHAKFTTAQLNFMRTYYRDETFRHPVKNTHIELHWLLDVDRKSALNDDVYNEGEKLVSVGGCEIPTLPDMFNTLYLCMHGSHHGWYRLFWLWDFAAIIKDATDTEAEQLISYAKKYNSYKALGQSIALCATIFSIKIPDRLKQVPVPADITRMAVWYIFVPNLMDFSNSPNRVWYKLSTFSTSFFFKYYFLRLSVFLLRKYKGTR